MAAVSLETNLSSAGIVITVSRGRLVIWWHWRVLLTKTLWRTVAVEDLV